LESREYRPIISTPPPEPSGKWEKIRISNYFWAEGACAADVDGNGHTDILSGPYWYAGPDFKTRHTIYDDAESFPSREGDIPGFLGELSGKNGRSNNFLSYAHDINGNGRPDYLGSIGPARRRSGMRILGRAVAIGRATWCSR
jgi:hypothetical protein